jgi:hypothetical protein
MVMDQFDLAQVKQVRRNNHAANLAAAVARTQQLLASADADTDIELLNTWRRRLQRQLDDQRRLGRS